MGQVESEEQRRKGADADGQGSWRLDAKDLITAYQAHYLGQMLRGQRWLVRALLLGALGILLVLVTGAPVQSLMLPVLIGLVLMVVVQLVLIIVWVPFWASRVFAQQRGLHGEMRATWNAAGLQVTTNEADARMPWNHVIRWCEDANNVRLYHSDALFQVVPKRALKASELSALRRAASAAGVSGASGV